MSSTTTTPTSNASDTSTDTDRPDGDQSDTDRAATAGDRLWAALRARPGATADQLAGEAGIGRSTAAKILARWIGDGTAARVPTDGKRSASRFTIPAASTDTAPDTGDDTGAVACGPHSAPQVGPTSPDPEPAHDAATDEDEHSHEVEETVSAGAVIAATDLEMPPAVDEAPVIGRVTTTSNDIEAPGGDDSDILPGPAHAGGALADDTNRPAGIGAAGTVEALPVRGPRLAPGALHGMVEDYLREHPEEQIGATTIGRALSRSTGAVANALERLVTTGYAVRTKDHPKRYTLAAAEGTGPDQTDTAEAASGGPRA